MIYNKYSGTVVSGNRTTCPHENHKPKNNAILKSRTPISKPQLKKCIYQCPRVLLGQNQ